MICDPQPGAQQIDKWRGSATKTLNPGPQRYVRVCDFPGGFDIRQMASEFRALRASVIRLWSKSGGAIGSTDIGGPDQVNDALITKYLGDQLLHARGEVVSRRGVGLWISSPPDDRQESGAGGLLIHSAVIAGLR